jgi:class 3 adenylate cyclase/tetratricopeptide (TPR) repeat protein
MTNQLLPTATDRRHELISFVPRLTLEWLRSSPDQRWLEMEATLAFVDISGFTAMSEQLSSRGRLGAEEVTDVMNATFAALLEVAYAEGGGLLKFGGDALLLLYEGDDHAARAAKAAFEMRRTLRAIGRPRTSAGPVTLRMHAGLHSGRFHFFLVGDSHRELLVSGPAATRTVEMEAASEAGEIVVSPETAVLLPPESVGEDKGPGLLLTSAPDVNGTLELLPDVSGIPLEVAVPAPLRAQLLDVGPLEGEHRAAAVAFVRFSGIDDIVATEGPVSAAEAVEGVVRGIQAAADEHLVTFLESDVDRDGGRIVLVAGAPQTFGDDEERLLRTMRAALDSGLPLPVHVGVSRGRVFTGQVGAPFRRTYTILGDTAALAARLMARAPEDEIWVSADAYDRGGARFVARDLEPFQVKGKSEPVRAVVLGELQAGEAIPPAEDVGGGRLPFVDRERERAVLGASVAPVRMGFGTLVELIGEPGIGKSRLAEELRQNCADMEQLTLRCEQYESSTPYYPFRPFLRSLLNVELNGSRARNRDLLGERLSSIDPDLEPWAPLLAAPLDVDVETTPEVDDLEPSFRRARLHGVMSTLLGRLLDSPTLLVFEDVHWMDDASSELLRHLGTQLSTHPWLTCTTRRPGGGGFAASEGAPPLPALTLRLEPLPAEDAKTLARAAAGDREVSDDELAAITERAAGNPLFLRELAAPGDGGEETVQLPETVEALVATRIDRLAPADRALLRWASVLGPAFSGAVIAEVLEDDPTAAADSDAWDRLAEFVERDPHVAGGFRFRHALIRDAAYDGLSYRRRRELHGRVAEVVEKREAGEAVELLSLHFHRAERWPETWRYSLEAGHRARAKWANLEAVEFYRRAIDASRSSGDLAPAEVAAVWEATGDCLRLLGDLEEAGVAFAAARKLQPKESAASVALLRKEGLLRDDMGRYEEAVRWFDRGLAAAATLGDEGERVRFTTELRLALAQTRFRQGAFDDCIRRFEELVAEALQASDIATLAPAYLILGLVHAQLGSPHRAAYRGLALPLYEDLGDLRGQASALNNLGIEAYYEGDWVKAADLYDRSRKLHERIGDATHVGMTTNNIGEILSDQGRLDEAARLFETVVANSETIGHRALAGVAQANLGRVAARAGRFEEAQEILEDALERLRETGAGAFVNEAEARLAELDTLRGDRPQEAIERLELSSAVREHVGGGPFEAMVQRIRAAALLQLGERGQALAALQSSIAAARASDARFELALSLDLLGRASGDGTASEESARLFELLGVAEVARPPLD